MSISKSILQTALSLYALSIPFQVIGQTPEMQEGITHSGQQTGQPAYPVRDYVELPNPTPTPTELWDQLRGTTAGWGRTDERYEKERPVPSSQLTSELTLQGWRGEKLSAQWVVSAGGKDLELQAEVSDLKHQGSRERISREHIQTAFVRYVLTDELNKDGRGACGHRLAKDYDSTLVADAIDHLTQELHISKHTTRGGWVSIEVPRQARAGVYTGHIKIKDGRRTLARLPLKVEVSERVLPEPKDWKFHLDLWQNPYAAARYYQTDLWSPEHFKAMEKDFQNYANAGGKSITATIIDRPWDGQTHDEFHSMVRWTKKLDGSWSFNFDVFDKWVEFMRGFGMEKIYAYSMIPWKLSFAYFDEATNTTKQLETRPGEAAYEEVWVPMLTAFAAHLKQKGWFKNTFIAMDERPMEAMQETLKVIQKADKDFKVSFAGGLHPELFEDIDDYSLTLNKDYPEGAIAQRAEQGKISTFYTSCAHADPNSFTFSLPAETQWYGWHAASSDLSGYLRWAYNSWVLEPLLDSRFTTWAAGDTYLVYPGGRSSIRFEKLIEGIQAYEKLHILKAEFQEEGNTEGLQRLEEIFALFTKERLEENSASEIIQRAKESLHAL